MLSVCAYKVSTMFKLTVTFWPRFALALILGVFSPGIAATTHAQQIFIADAQLNAHRSLLNPPPGKIFLPLVFRDGASIAVVTNEADELNGLGLVRWNRSGDVKGAQLTLALDHSEIVVVALPAEFTQPLSALNNKVLQLRGTWAKRTAALLDLPGGEPARIFEASQVQILNSDSTPSPLPMPKPTPNWPYNAAQSALAAAQYPAGFSEQNVVSGLTQPTGFAFAPDGRIFIAEKSGVVRVFQNGALLSTPFINLQSEVNNFSDRGLVSVAVHPQFPTQPYIYIYYVYSANGTDNGTPSITLVERITADAAFGYNQATPNGRTILLGAAGKTNLNLSVMCENASGYLNDCIPNDSTWHYGGQLVFGKDGSLYLSTGDSFYNDFNPRSIRAQDVDSPAGKLLRFDPITGNGYADNPFFDGDATHIRSKVYSRGLRNAFRVAIHPVTGEPVIGDVGLSLYDEVDTGRGANFGWPCYEGGTGRSLQQPSFAPQASCQALYAQGESVVKPPLFAYAHNGGGASITGGDYYTGLAYPAQYRNNYFFGDYNNNFINALAFDAAGVPTASRFATGVEGLVQLTHGPDTNLYSLNIIGGTLNRIRYTAGNTPPSDWLRP